MEIQMTKNNNKAFQDDDYLWIILLWIILYSVLLGYLLGNAGALLNIRLNFSYMLGLLSSVIINVSLGYGFKNKFGKIGFYFCSLSSGAFMVQNYMNISPRLLQIFFSLIIILSLALSIYKQVVVRAEERNPTKK
jgi:hypothetical protein